MTADQRNRYEAARILAIAASNDPATLDDIALALGHDLRRRGGPVRIARRALSRSVGAGTWREVRAEAEARLRCNRRWR